MDKPRKKPVKYVIWGMTALLFVIWMFCADDIILKINRIETVFESSLDSFEEKDEVLFCLGNFSDNGDIFETVSIDGWAFVETEGENENRKISIIFCNEKHCYVGTMFSSKRRDVYLHFKDDKKIPNTNVGFNFDFSIIPMKDGIYQVYLYCWENSENYGLADLGIRVKKDGASFLKYEGKEG